MNSSAFGRDYFEGKKSHYATYGEYEYKKPQIKEFYNYLNKKNLLNGNSLNILELGCAYGHFLKFLQENGHKVTGIDISNYAVKKAKQNKVNAIQANAEKELALKNNSFDLIFSLDTIEHLEKPEKMIENCRKLLKENGKLLIITPNKKMLPVWRKFYGIKLSDETHISLMDSGEIKKLFTAWKKVETKTIFWGKLLNPNKSLNDKALLFFSGLLDLFKLGTYIEAVAEK